MEKLYAYLSQTSFVSLDDIRIEKLDSSQVIKKMFHYFKCSKNMASNFL